MTSSSKGPKIDQTRECNEILGFLASPLNPISQGKWYIYPKHVFQISKFWSNDVILNTKCADVGKTPFVTLQELSFEVSQSPFYEKCFTSYCLFLADASIKNVDVNKRFDVIVRWGWQTKPRMFVYYYGVPHPRRAWLCVQEKDVIKTTHLIKWSNALHVSTIRGLNLRQTWLSLILHWSHTHCTHLLQEKGHF